MKLMENGRQLPQVEYKGYKFKEHEICVLELVAEGWTNNEIAEELGISKRTVENHLYNVRKVISDLDQKEINDRRLVLMSKKIVDLYQNYRDTLLQKVVRGKENFLNFNIAGVNWMAAASA